MILEELKTQWNTLDQNLLATCQFNEKMLRSMLTDRSRGTLAIMQSKTARIAMFFTALLALFTAILAGNPFDYTHWLHYLPAFLYLLVVAAALAVAVNEYLFLRRVNLTGTDLRESLSSVIRVHERYQRLAAKIWKLSLVAGFLLGISLLAPRYEAFSSQKIALVIAAQALIVLLVYAAARRLLQNLPDPQLASIKATLAELEAD
ncbi:hypothetical protein [Dyadobacter sp. Leaf189]|uniref:hypothetical protein n=1 Tax=Dyadobacter sp. Leaf189 TaxID=1736295 RepID=UPI0006FCAAB4|nr:hypothetical protein [Dyadobacter sp. Leaf189]KQS27770.1 hypothetical protein ASG33_15190 [Dyadobacter sp. Leaf189]